MAESAADGVVRCTYYGCTTSDCVSRSFVVFFYSEVKGIKSGSLCIVYGFTYIENPLDFFLVGFSEIILHFFS